MAKAKRRISNQYYVMNLNEVLCVAGILRFCLGYSFGQLID